MAIVEMKKFTLFALLSAKESLLKSFQRFENVELKDLKIEDNEKYLLLSDLSSSRSVSEIDSELAKLEFIRENLKPFASKKNSFKDKPKSIDFDTFDSYVDKDYQSVYTSLRSIEENIRALNSELTVLKNEQETYRAWLTLDTSTEYMKKMKSTNYVLGYVASISYNLLKEEIESKYKNAYIETTGTHNEEAYLAILLHKSIEAEALVALRDLGFIRANLTLYDTAKNVMDKDTRRIDEITKEIKSLEDSKIEYKDIYEETEIIKESLNTKKERLLSYELLKASEKTIVLEGWFPSKKEESFKKSIVDICSDNYYLELEEVEKDSKEVPIKLKNNSIVGSFEGITEMFGLPKYNEIDPTAVVFPFYWLFFGFMVGDVGYGLVMLIGTIFMLKTMHLKPGMKKMLKMFSILSVGVIFAGFFYGGFFGITFFTPIKMPDGSSKAIFDSQLDIVLMLLVSMAAGYVQLMFGLLVKMYIGIRDRDYMSVFFDSFTWIVAITTGIIFLAGLFDIVPANITSICKIIFITSIIILALTQGRDAKTVGGKVASGLFSVYGISGYVGDIVSYTRIAALALSGSYISFSFHQMGGLLKGMGILGLLLQIIVFLIGQSLNFGLSSLGAYVHTCRLQYVEYFGKFYEGGGKVFRPLSYKNQSVNINKI